MDEIPPEGLVTAASWVGSGGVNGADGAANATLGFALMAGPPGSGEWLHMVTTERASLEARMGPTWRQRYRTGLKVGIDALIEECEDEAGLAGLRSARGSLGRVRKTETPVEVRLDTVLLRQAQAIAEERGLPLETIINEALEKVVVEPSLRP